MAYHQHLEYGLSGDQTVSKVSSKDPAYRAWCTKHLEDLKIGDDSTPLKLKQQVLKLLYSYREVFAENPSAPEAIKGVVHNINLVVGQPVIPKKERLRRFSPKELAAMYEACEGMLRNGIVQPSTSPWAANVIMVPKPKDPLKGMRFAVDYRYLNKFTIGDSMVLPRIDDLLDSLADCEIFSMMDCAAGFWATNVNPAHRELTAFNTWTHGQLEFVRMPFGLKNAPATYQRTMGNILHPYVCDGVVDPARYIHRVAEFCKAAPAQAKATVDKVRRRIASLYIDDVCVHGSIDNHVNDLAKILKRLRGNNVSLKMVKCEFAVTKGAFLGFVVEAQRGVLVDPKKVSAIAQMSRPKTVADVRTLLGATSFLRRFVPDYSDVTLALRTVQQLYPSKHSVIEDADWSEDCQQAFDILKCSLCTAPALAFPDWSKPFCVCCDASGTQLGAALCQVDDQGIERPIQYASRSLIAAEKNYGISDLEGLAVTWALRMWRPYLQGTKSVVVTDHSSLCWLLTKPHLRSRRQERYALDLMEFDISIVHRAGHLNSLADCLSRAQIEFDESKLNQELSKLGDLQDQRLRDGKFEPGSELSKWQTVLGNRGAAGDLQGMSRKWADQTKLQLLIAGGCLSPDNTAKNVHTKLHQLQNEVAEEELCQGHDEYCRASEIYGFVASVAPSLANSFFTVATNQPLTRAAKAKAAAGQQSGSATTPVQPVLETGSASSKATRRKQRSLKQVQSAIDKLSEQVVQDTASQQDSLEEVTRLSTRPQPLTLKRVQQSQVRDPFCVRITKVLSSTAASNREKQLSERLHQEYALKDGVLHKIVPGVLHQKVVPQIPDDLVQDAIFSCHDLHHQGHPGFVRTYQKAYEQFHWKGMYRDVHDFCRLCNVCQMHAPAPAAAPIAGHITASRPGEGWVIDVLHMLPSEQGHVAILVAVDVFSRFCVLVPM